MARLLGLELNPSGGAALEALALRGDEKRFAFTPPLASNWSAVPSVLIRSDHVPLHEVLLRPVGGVLKSYPLLGSALTTIWDFAATLLRVIEISAIMALSEAPVIVAVAGRVLLPSPIFQVLAVLDAAPCVPRVSGPWYGCAGRVALRYQA